MTESTEKPYLFVIERGNGYRCSCCRRTYTETAIYYFSSPEAAVERASAITSSDEDEMVEAVYPLLTENPVYPN